MGESDKEIGPMETKSCGEGVDRKNLSIISYFNGGMSSSSSLSNRLPGFHMSYPPNGFQMDLNRIWHMVEGFTQQLAQYRTYIWRMVESVRSIQNQNIQTICLNKSSPEAKNGGEVSATSSDSGRAEIERLRNSLMDANTRIDRLESENRSLTCLISEYENAMQYILQKLRPYAQQQADALIATRAHYTSLLEAERQVNLELRAEHQTWQTRFTRVAEYVRMAYEEHTNSVLTYISRIQELKSENRTLRRLAGLKEIAESSDEESKAEVT